MRVVKWTITAVVIAFLIAPLLVVAIVSINENRYMDFPPQGTSFHWYAELFNDIGWRDSIVRTLVIAMTSSALAVVIATPLAYVLRAYDIRLAPLIYALGILPFMLPPVISAIGAQVFWLSTGYYNRIENVIVSHSIFFSTLPLVTISLAMEQMDRSLGEAAQTLGANPRTTFRTITLPLLLPSIITGYAAAFVLSLNEYIIAFLVAGFAVETLPIKLFNSLRYGFTPTIAAVAVVFILVAATVFSLFALFGNLLRFLGADPEILERDR
ncbi:MAG TPA: ABC transporter permease [Actinomycetota bacterium]|jgi:putative spermidine/putrescine transport system permease protein|nr:ABC transporter permease [Actinomycetota bacterium]